MRRISCYFIPFVIVLGLLSRKIVFLPYWIGDALWAGLVYLVWAVLFPQLGARKLALLALITSWLVEFSQLIQLPWLVAFRATTIGHLLLGQGFLVSDLLAYVLGIGLIYFLMKRIEKFS